MQVTQKNLLLSVLGALLLWAAWPISPFTFLLFIAWVPLLTITDSCSSIKKYFGLTYLHMILWNVLTTWWVSNASLEGALSAFFANSLIMCIPWLLYYLTKKWINGALGTLSIIPYWLAFEYIHHNWDLSWPWLTLGNAFATHPQWIQWYEYTGTSGGSLWVLISNVLVYHIIKLYQSEGRTTKYFKYAIIWIALLFIPILFSFFIKNKLTLQHNKYNVVVVQPNIDPYQKFDISTQHDQLKKLITLSEKAIDHNTALIVWPETAIPFQTDERQIRESAFLEPLWEFLKKYPSINLLTGLEGVQTFNTKVSRYTRATFDNQIYYEMYNSAVLLNSQNIQIYHKSKLVPGVEVLPSFLSFMAPLFEKFGGTAGGYARDSATHVFSTLHHLFQITPAICYESIYGDYLAEFNRKNANLICVITNDGWWGDTPGYKQHMNYARLRAIESRKWIARSANTGISCFIDPFGNIIQQLNWDTEGTLKQTVAAYTTETFYTKYGDILSQIASFAAAALLLYTIIWKFKKRN